MITLICSCSPVQQTPQIFFSVVKDALPLLLAVLLAYIAYQQYAVNRNKLRLDLFEKRYLVFRQLKDLIIMIHRHAGIENEEFREKYERVSEGEFLFDKEVYQFINTIHVKNIQLLQLKLNLGPNNGYNDEMRKEFINKKYEILNSLLVDLDSMENFFTKYLLFKKVRINRISLFFDNIFSKNHTHKNN